MTNREPLTGVNQAVQEIAGQLGEREPGPIGIIRRLVALKGADFAHEYVRQALEIEAGGGLMTADGSRRRTLGGVFFYLVRATLTGTERRTVFPPPPWQKKASAGATRKQEIPAFNWPDRIPLVAEASKERGEARTVKVTLIGKPGKVIQREHFIVTVMKGPKKAPSLPKGLPMPPEGKQPSYVVYISAKQWRKVAPALSDPEDTLIVEGYLAFDPELKAFALYATNATTQALQRAQREAQQKGPP